VAADLRMGGAPTRCSGDSRRVGWPPILNCRVTRYRETVPIPEAVRASIIRRMRAMDRCERSIVMWASVIGCRFDVAILVEAAPCDEARVRAALERAHSLELVEPGPAQGEYFSFRHALVRDVIYAEFVSLRVRLLHRRIARAVQRAASAGEAPIAELAYHYWAGGDSRQALRYNELAGDNAAALHARTDARAFYLRALGLVNAGSRSYARLQKKLELVGERST
jgi:predicted ATPase